MAADHGFQDMVVFPGSFYIDLALSVHRNSPIILSNDDAQITIDVTDRVGTSWMLLHPKPERG